MALCKLLQGYHRLVGDIVYHEMIPKYVEDYLEDKDEYEQCDYLNNYLGLCCDGQTADAWLDSYVTKYYTKFNPVNLTCWRLDRE